MIHALLVRNDASALWLDGWRIPRAEVTAFASAHELLDFARSRAAQLEVAVQAAFEAAQRRGYADGLAEGRAEAEQATASALANLANAADTQGAELRASVGMLALDVVRRIAGEIGAEALAARIVEQALADLIDAAPYLVRVAPCAANAVAQRIGARHSLRVTADPSMAPDGCVFETNRGLIDASLEIQLAALTQAFAAAGVAS